MKENKLPAKNPEALPNLPSPHQFNIVGNVPPPQRAGVRWRKTHKNKVSFAKILREIKRPFLQFYAPIDIILNRSKKLKQAEREFPTVLSLNETVDLLIRGASICRYGDGEFRCLKWAHSTDKDSPEGMLARRLEEVLATPSSEQLVIAVPPFNPNPKGTSKYGWLNFWEMYWSENWESLRERLIKRSFGNSFVSRAPVFGEVDIEKIRSIWAGRDVVFVAGNNSRFFDDPRLFDTIKSVEYLYVEATRAYVHYDTILQQALSFDKSKLFIICAGYMATVLAFDLYHHGYQALDMGHLPNCYQEYLKETPPPEWMPYTIER